MTTQKKTKFYTLVNKYANEIKEHDIDDLLFAFKAKDDTDTLSLYSIIMMFDNEALMTRAVKDNQLDTPSNLKVTFSELVREGHATGFYALNCLKALALEYDEAIPIFISSLVDYYDDDYLANVICKHEIAPSHHAMLRTLSDLLPCLHNQFKGRALCDEIKSFSGTAYTFSSKQAQQSFLLIALCFMLFKKRSEGMTLDTLMTLDELSTLIENKSLANISNKTFVIAALFVFEKTPFELLKVEADWVKTTAVELITDSKKTIS